MSLKRRNRIALFLIILAAVCWTFGQRMSDADVGSPIKPTTPSTMPTGTHSNFPTVPSGMSTTGPSPAPSAPGQTGGRSGRIWGIALSFGAVAAAFAAVFLFSQKDPLFGPDGIGVMLALLATAERAGAWLGLSPGEPLLVLWENMTACAVLLAARELLGWLRARCALSWCLVQRIAGRATAPRAALVIYAGWPLILAVACTAAARSLGGVLGFGAAAVLAACCLWRYGAGLKHFQQQLERYRQGLPITVGDGAFAQTEAQLLEVQARHEEAVRAAVTSERFKVELISNVSHDLRTPLTSILGYSELLEKETLSPEGQEQLRRLHQKAGYMNDLVESLFELTKVSSGVAESKKEKIDLVRLLEQTIGLFDDQLVQAGLTVRRNYCADTIAVITDGARMHQVFANLLGNAIKYALAGTRIYIEVKETGSRFLVRMMNTASYEMDFQPEEIVQRFARGDKARSTKGSGLGLAIAQTYTESVGGSFRVAVDGDQFSAIVELPKSERNL